MDAYKARKLRSFLNEVFNEASMRAKNELGVSLEVGGITYSNRDAVIKISAVEMVAGKVVSKEESDFKAQCWRFGFSASDLGRSFSTPQGTYKITGLKPRNHRYPIIGESRNGKSFKFPAEYVKRYL